MQVGNASALPQKLYVVVVERNSKKSLVIFGSDSCPKNTGQWARVAAELEKLLKRVLQRILCLKRMLEILWHYFFKHSEHSIFVVASPEDPQKAPASHLTTSGPSAFKGPWASV